MAGGGQVSGRRGTMGGLMPTPASDQTTAYLLPQSVIPRTIAYLIDTAVVAVLTAILMAAGVLQDGGLETLDPDAIREMLQSNSGLAVYLILFAYFLICEGVWGRTAGKAALGMRVVRIQDGSPCGWSRSIVRNLIRPLDLLFARHARRLRRHDHAGPAAHRRPSRRDAGRPAAEGPRRDGGDRPRPAAPLPRLRAAGAGDRQVPRLFRPAAAAGCPGRGRAAFRRRHVAAAGWA